MTNEIVALNDAKSRAIFHANLAEQHKTNAVIEAAKSGAALNEVKAQLPHGEFTPWVEANMPVTYRQCAKYMKLATERPALLTSNVKSTSLLSIDTEFKLLTVDGDVEATVREAAAKDDLTQKQISDLIKQLESAKAESQSLVQRAEEWRQQANDNQKRMKEAKELLKNRDLELATLRGSIHEEAKNIARTASADLSARLQSAMSDKSELMDKLASLERSKKQAIQDGVTASLKGMEQEIQIKQSALDGIEKQIAELRRNAKALSAESRIRAKHESSMRDADLALNSLKLAFIDAFDGEGGPGALPADVSDVWLSVASELEKAADTIRSTLRDPQFVSRIEREVN